MVDVGRIIEGREGAPMARARAVGRRANRPDITAKEQSPITNSSGNHST
jgi:hypothetical protein